MKKPKLVLGVSALAMTGILAMAGCATQGLCETEAAADENAESSVTVISTGLDPLAEWQTSDSQDPMEIYNGIYEGLDERAENHQPEITTYDDGVRVQRTPNKPLDSTLQVHDHISFNTYRLDADNRGCLGCHDDLAKTAANTKGYPHLDLSNNALGIEWTEAACRGCHVGHFATKYDEWSGLIHGIHNSAKNEMFVEQGGSCWSCHYGETVGDTPGMSLWDEVKHEVMHGIELIDSETMNGEFAYDQDKTVPADGMFSYSYIRDRTNEVAGERWAREYLGMESGSNGDTFDTWNITIGGECENPATMTLQEMIDTFPSETHIIQGQCVDNGPGGSLVHNIEVKGIMLKDLFEYFGMKDGVNSIIATGADGSTSGYGIDRIIDGDIILGYEVGGEPLTYASGYPVQVFTPGTALDGMKSVVDLEFSTEPGEVDEAHPHGAHDLDGNNYIYPNVAICNLREGQIIPVGEPFTFEGYAAAINSGITSIELSMDQGKTWQTFETPDNDWKKWTWWNYTWTPENPGWYTLTVRATADDGTVSYYPAEMMVTVEDTNGGN